MGKVLVKTDLAIAIPHDCYGRIALRSGLAWKYGIDVGAGVIDADYRGNVGIILFNLSDSMFVIHPGDRIAQLIIEKILHCEVKETTDLLPDPLCHTSRGEMGFGSSGGYNMETNARKLDL
jgi:dUTP pyrophosphatase